LKLFGLVYSAQAAPPDLEKKARARLRARAANDFAEADELRHEIEAAGWEVRDVEHDPGYQLVPKS
jgi:cysteinyl-tRNA synthetase